MIEVRQLTKKYGDRTVVREVSFEVAEGETLVLLGTSGSGKTTTLKMLNRIVEPTSGSIHLNGKNILEMDPVGLRRSIGYVIQRIGLFPHYTVARNVGLVPSLLEWEDSRIQNRVNELLARLDLDPEIFRDRFPAQLSGGQRQRVGIARALAANPELVLLDEPFGALDPVTRGQIVREFQTLPDLRDKTMVLVTHDMQEAFLLGDRIALMDEGEILQLDTPEQLLHAPANEFVERFLASNRLELELQTMLIGQLLPFLPAELQEKWRPQAEKSLHSVLEPVKGGSSNSLAPLWAALEKFREVRDE